MFTFSSSCSRHCSPLRWESGIGSMSRCPVNGFLFGWVALRHSSQYDTSHVTHVLTASWGGSCSQNWHWTGSGGVPGLDMAALTGTNASRLLPSSPGELGPLGGKCRGRGSPAEDEARCTRSIMFCKVTFLLSPSSPRSGLREMTYLQVGHWKAPMLWTDSLVAQWEMRMRWAQPKHRLWAQGSRSGSSKSSRQIGQVSSDSRVSILLRRSQAGPGTVSTKSKRAAQPSVRHKRDRCQEAQKEKKEKRDLWLNGVKQLYFLVLSSEGWYLSGADHCLNWLTLKKKKSVLGWIFVSRAFWRLKTRPKIKSPKLKKTNNKKDTAAETIKVTKIIITTLMNIVFINFKKKNREDFYHCLQKHRCNEDTVFIFFVF